MTISSEIKGITATIIFEASALNRDDKIGNNVLSIKKLTRDGNKTYSYLSKVSIRHHLFNTLNKINLDSWVAAPCAVANGGVIQLDLTKSSIITHAELDAFGYMFTSANLTRKGTIGITKAIALEEWQGDMQFNANHDFVKRAMSTPNPVNKEEQLSYYKLSFTIDVERLGTDTWLAESYNYENNVLSISFKVEKDSKESEKSEEEVKEIEIKKDNKGKKEKPKKVEEVVYQTDAIKIGDNLYLIKRNNIDIGTIELVNTHEKSKKHEFKLKINESEKIRRIKDIMSVIKNGIMFHSGGENYGIIPVFIISAGLKIPVPLFNSFVKLNNFDTESLNNDYIINKDNTKFLFIQNSQNIVGHIDDQESYNNWNNYLKNLGVIENA